MFYEKNDLHCDCVRQSATIAFLSMRNRLNHTQNGVRLTKSTSVKGHTKKSNGRTLADFSTLQYSTRNPRNGE